MKQSTAQDLIFLANSGHLRPFKIFEAITKLEDVIKRFKEKENSKKETINFYTEVCDMLYVAAMAEDVITDLKADLNFQKGLAKHFSEEYNRYYEIAKSYMTIEELTVRATIDDVRETVNRKMAQQKLDIEKKAEKN